MTTIWIAGYMLGFILAWIVAFYVTYRYDARHLSSKDSRIDYAVRMTPLHIFAGMAWPVLIPAVGILAIGWAVMTLVTTGVGWIAHRLLQGRR